MGKERRERRIMVRLSERNSTRWEKIAYTGGRKDSE
jgi:hypothetical protein